MPGNHHRHGWSLKDALSSLEGPERLKEQDPERFWRTIGVEPGETIVDVGSGTGYFAIPATTLVTRRGKVYAVDISEELVALMEERKTEMKLSNLTPVLSTETNIPLPDGIADIVLMANLLHDAPRATVLEAIRILRPSGRFVDLDWKKEETPKGPPMEIRLTMDEATERLIRFGLERIRALGFGPHHYVLEMRKAR